nr:hypothetical protein [Ralstonia pseudosolanacearum]
MSIHTGSGTLDNTRGAVSASGAATIQAGNLVNQGGTVAARRQPQRHRCRPRQHGRRRARLQRRQPDGLQRRQCH